jgi:hypothetical protein
MISAAGTVSDSAFDFLSSPLASSAYSAYSAHCASAADSAYSVYPEVSIDWNVVY